MPARDRHAPGLPTTRCSTAATGASSSASAASRWIARSRRRCGRPTLEPGKWLRADATFKPSSGEEDGEGGRWHKNKPLPETWALKVLGVTVLGRLTSFRHLGLFPEQLPHWQWMLERLGEVRGETPRVLNLFAYTGAASLIAAHAGAEVTHVDASKRAIAWAKQNQAVSKLSEAHDPLDPGRRAQVRRPRGAARQELPRDPGRSPQVRARAGGRGVGRVPAPGPAAARLRSPAGAGAGVAGAHELCHPRLGAGDGRASCANAWPAVPAAIESGELAVVEEAGGRLLPTSHYTRWTSHDAAS